MKLVACLFVLPLYFFLSIKPSFFPQVQANFTDLELHSFCTETLVHSTLEHCDDADFTFSVYFNMKENTVYVRQRPYLDVFLKRVAEMFEVIVFTASQSIYAEQLLNILDPDRKFISQRVYRESCVFSDGAYTKDLTVLGLDLAKVAIVDNSPQVIFSMYFFSQWIDSLLSFPVIDKSVSTSTV